MPQIVLGVSRPPPITQALLVQGGAARPAAHRGEGLLLPVDRGVGVGQDAVDLDGDVVSGLM